MILAFLAIYISLWTCSNADEIISEQIRKGRIDFYPGVQPVLWYLEIGPWITSPPRYDELTPRFILYGDGTLIYRVGYYDKMWRWKRMRLNEREMKEILVRVLKSGITSYDPVRVKSKGGFMVTDCPTTVIGVVLENTAGMAKVRYVKEIAIYNLKGAATDKPGDPVFKGILDLAEFLKEYKHPEAEDYDPETAEIIVIKVPRLRYNRKSEGHSRIREWKVKGVELDKAERRGFIGVIELKGKRLKEALKVLSLNDPPNMFRYKDRFYWILFRPVLPMYPRAATYFPSFFSITSEGYIRPSP